MYQKVNLRIFFYFVVLFFLSCSLIPSKTKVIPILGGMEITLPFYVKSGFRFIQLSLAPDQKPLRFLVDTGSRFSFLDERFFTELDSKKRIVVSYPGGKDDSYRKIKTVQLFHNVYPIFRDMTVYSHNFSGHLELDGIIGIDSLYEKILILEYPTQIRFLEILDGKLMPGFRDAEPLRFVSGLPVLEVNYGTQDKSLLILDTGAEPSVLELPNPLPGIVEETFSSRSVSVLNFQGKVVNIRTRFVRKLCLVPTSICVEDLEILPSGLPVELSKAANGIRIQGVLGVNWLNKHRILLDMKRSLIGIVGKDQ
ncbi:retropepsin-like aspartic protease [Leptospira noguchii]|uniref:Putative lipoprotein n=2 Tax=Leptospira noguchii TaxID=28182 RepID=T0F9M1_9LEPT|nr:retropepsin-like aspartic protease [Leptospira noguchii]EMO53663.1 putative lipoprotein [Leptospira noguchii]EQA69903.1 putative lipoprotein [Leptospira noguchii serovar Panama str. CZ214]